MSMCPLKLLWRVLLLLSVFAGVGLTTSHLVIAHAVAGGAKVYEVRLAGLMAGLFAGAIATAFAGLVLVLRSPGQRRRSNR